MSLSEKSHEDLFFGTLLPTIKIAPLFFIEWKKLLRLIISNALGQEGKNWELVVLRAWQRQLSGLWTLVTAPRLLVNPSCQVWNSPLFSHREPSSPDMPNLTTLSMQKGIKASLFILFIKNKSMIKEWLSWEQHFYILAHKAKHTLLSHLPSHQAALAVWALFLPGCLPPRMRKGQGAWSAGGLTRRLPHPKATQNPHGKDIHFGVIASHPNKAAHSQIRFMRSQFHTSLHSHHNGTLPTHPLELSSSKPSSQKTFPQTLRPPAGSGELLLGLPFMLPLHPLHTMIAIPTTLYWSLVYFTQGTFNLVLNPS